MTLLKKINRKYPFNEITPLDQTLAQTYTYQIQRILTGCPNRNGLEYEFNNSDWMYNIFGLSLLNKLVLAITSNDIEFQTVQEAVDYLNIRMQNYPSSSNDKSLILSFFNKLDQKYKLEQVSTVEQVLIERYARLLNNIFQNTPDYQPIAADMYTFYTRLDYAMMCRLILALEDNNENKEQKRLELVEKLRIEIAQKFSNEIKEPASGSQKL